MRWSWYRGAAADVEQHGETQTAEGTATLGPVRHVEDFDRRVIIPMLESGGKAAQGFGVEQGPYRILFFLRRRPEALTQWDLHRFALHAFFRKMLP
jgi:hypothetical protein